MFQHRFETEKMRRNLLFEKKRDHVRMHIELRNGCSKKSCLRLRKKQKISGVKFSDIGNFKRYM